jgi:hypothetical protein
MMFYVLSTPEASNPLFSDSSTSMIRQYGHFPCLANSIPSSRLCKQLTVSSPLRQVLVRFIIHVHVGTASTGNTGSLSLDTYVAM